MKLQELVNLCIENGLTDLELNIINKKDIEIGYVSFAPVTVLEIVNSRLSYIVFLKPVGIDDYFGTIDKKIETFNFLNKLYNLKDLGYNIDCSDAEEIVGIPIFHRHKNGGYLKKQREEANKNNEY